MHYPFSENKGADQLLICVFVFAYADCWVSHDVALIRNCLAMWTSKIPNLPAQLCHAGICSSGGCSETGAQMGTVLVVQGKNSIN